MDQIIPGLWIGDLACALATDYLSMAGITHIVTAMKQRLPVPINLPDGRRIEEDHIYHVNLDDVEDAPILVHFPGAIEFIDNALQQTWIEDDEDQEEEKEKEEGEDDNEIRQQQERESNSRTTPPNGKRSGQWATMGEGTVLVHCHAGISRSVAIVIAYLMHTRKISLSNALTLIRKRRSIADPNEGFIHQLELYQSANYEVDVRNQRIRRFIMSQFSILRGDPIDDVLLSYYPSPFHSPSNSNSSTTSFQWNGGQNGTGSPGGMAGMGLQFSKLDMDTSRSIHSGSDQSAPSSGRNSISMSRQNSRLAASSAAAKGAHERMQRRASKSSEDSPPIALTELSKEGKSEEDVENQIDLSISPPMPPMSKSLFDEDDEESNKRLRDEQVNNLIRENFTSISDSNEVMVTVNSGKLPGGVNKVRGNQTRLPSSSSIRQAQAQKAPSLQQQQQMNRLPKPHFTGRKLRCKKCRRELAAQDHVVEHEAGKGKDAFDVRKRKKDVEQNSRDNREAIGNANNNNMTIEQKFGSQTRLSHLNDDPNSEEEGKGEEKANADDQLVAKADDSLPPAAPSYKSAASLSAQLPPHLAALRQGGGIARPNQANGLDSSTNNNTTSTNNNNNFRKLLHSPLCSSYFVEPLAWMSVLRSGEVAGRLDCPSKRCGAKLGNWDWAGMQCACGAWVTPAFALHRSKVDEI